jgi:hypothetical protein
MNTLPNEMEKLATSVAIGSIFCFGTFLVLDVYNKSFFKFFEGYVETASFGVIAALPTLALLYILGALISLLSDFIFQLFNSKGYVTEWEMLAKVSRLNNSTLNSVFFDLYRKKKIIEGSLFPLLVLGMGVYLEHENHPHLLIPLVISGVTIIIFTCVLPLFTIRIGKNMVRFIAMIEQK